MKAKVCGTGLGNKPFWSDHILHIWCVLSVVNHTLLPLRHTAHAQVYKCTP